MLCVKSSYRLKNTLLKLVCACRGIHSGSQRTAYKRLFSHCTAKALTSEASCLTRTLTFWSWVWYMVVTHLPEREAEVYLAYMLEMSLGYASWRPVLHLLSRKANVLGFISFILFHICVIVLFSWASRGMDAVHTFIILPVVFENSPPFFQKIHIIVT